MRGDAGLAPRLTWNLPEGFVADDFVWPVPKRLPLGPLVSFGYFEEVLLPVRITPPSNLVEGTTVELKALADWLACREVLHSRAARCEPVAERVIRNAGLRYPLAQAIDRRASQLAGPIHRLESRRTPR